MALLERVGTLLRANVNDLIEKAEDPEKLAKQLVLDMENQLLQVKTQVAIAIADQHLLEKKKKEHEDAVRSWERKAELAVEKQEDDLARAALDRSLSHKQMAEGFSQQLDDQTAETETLRNAFAKLEQKLKETESTCEMLIAEHRRARAVGKAHSAKLVVDAQHKSVTLDRLRSRVAGHEAANFAAKSLMDGDTLEEKFLALERHDEIEGLLRDLKSKRSRSA
jgi:phage shock protein A